jgi:peptidyl-prolyl cis-trans isomerase C
MKRMAMLSIAALAMGSLMLGCGTRQDSAEPASSTPPPAEPAAQVAAPAPVPPPAFPATEPAATAPAATAVATPAANASEPVAKVNGHLITEGDVQKVLDTFMQQMGPQIPPEQLAEAMPRVRERIVEELVMRRVMLDAVAKEGLSLSDDEFAEVKAELSAELPPGVTLESYMEETGVTESEMREQMTVRKMILAKADSAEKPSDDEIKAFFEENKEGFAQDASVSASHILVKVDASDDDAAKAAKRERIEALRKQIVEGADFAQLAAENSDCPSASSGGDLGSFGRGQMVPAFEDAAFSQPVGEVGEVVETQFGYHLVLVTDKTEAKTLEFDDVKERISEILYSQKQQDVVRVFVDGIRAEADVERFDEPASEETMLQLDAEEEIEAVAVEEAVEAVEEAVEQEAVAEAVAEVEAAEELAEEAVAQAEEAGALEVVAEEIAEAVEEAKEQAAEAVAEIAPEVESAAEAAGEAVAEAAEVLQENAAEKVSEVVPAPADEKPAE